MPKSRGGRTKVSVHPIYHQTLHATFGNGELARVGQNLQGLRAHPDIARFVAWIADKSPDFHARTEKRRR